jgi:hypothetical protein
MSELDDYLNGHIASLREGDLPWWRRNWAEDER